MTMRALLAKILALTLLLYAMLYWRLVALQFGRVDMDPSPFVEPRVIKGHMVYLVAWWRLAVISVLLAAYAVLVAFMGRRRHRVLPTVQAAVLVFGVAGVLVLAIGWPFLGTVIHRMGDVALGEWWIELLDGIPGGIVVQILLVVTLQSLVMLGILELLARRRTRESRSPGDALPRETLR